MIKQEANLKRALKQLIYRELPNFYIISHEDVSKSGIPDWSISGNKKTSWLEFKHATPQFESDEIQEITCCSLAATSFCRYVIWRQYGEEGPKETLIVHPNSVRLRKDYGLKIENAAEGFDHQFVLNYIRGIHGV